MAIRGIYFLAIVQTPQFKSEGKIKLIILDDVVMSIDGGHRRNVWKLLTEYFPDNQFIITWPNKTLAGTQT